MTLPFGTALDAESSGATKRRFTSYDRSSATGLDYTVNRHYDSQQGRFTQVDPIGMSSTSLSNPQSLNLYSYVGNDPVNRTDPSGLFWGKLFGFLKKLVKVVMLALAVGLIVVAIVNIGNPLVSAAMIWGAFALAGLLFGLALGPSWMQRTISIAGVATGIYMQKPGAIWNFADPGNRGAPGIGAWLSAVSAINLFLQQQNPAQHDPACTRVNALFDNSGQGYYTYGPQNQRYGQPGMVAALQNFASGWEPESSEQPDRGR